MWLQGVYQQTLLSPIVIKEESHGAAHLWELQLCSAPGRVIHHVSLPSEAGPAEEDMGFFSPMFGSVVNPKGSACWCDEQW